MKGAEIWATSVRMLEARRQYGESLLVLDITFLKDGDEVSADSRIEEDRVSADERQTLVDSSEYYSRL